MFNNSKINESDSTICNLPDHILCHILSFLPTKYSVRTTVLSTRWEHLFTQVPVLDFEDPLITATRVVGEATANKFILFVYKVLLSYDVADMHQFILQCPGGQYDQHVNSWISVAIRRNVRKLRLWAHYLSQPLRLTRDICISKTLVDLTLLGASTLHLTLDDSMCLPNLKKLYLSHVVIRMGESNRVCFSSCPMLEDLYLGTCSSFHINGGIIDISVASLKSLALSSNRRLDFVLNVPALEFLYYYFHEDTKISGNVFLSLHEAKICVYSTPKSPHKNGFQKLFEMASNVPNLFLDSLLLEVLVDGGSLPYFRNLTCLELKILRKVELKKLLDLLERSPNLGILIIHCGCLGKVDGVDVDMDHVLPIREFACLSSHLKVFEIRRFSGTESMFKFVEYILSNAKVLNKMIIRTDEPLDSRYLISQKILALSKYSRDCKVLIASNNSYSTSSNLS